MGRPVFLAKPAGSWVCAGDAAGPVAAVADTPGGRAAWPPRAWWPGCLMLVVPGRPSGLPAAALARVCGGRIQGRVVWRRGRGPARLRGRHQPLPGTRAGVVAARAPVSSASAAGPRVVSRPVPAAGPGRDAIPGPAPDDCPVLAAVAPAAGGRRAAIAGRPAPRRSGRRELGTVRAAVGVLWPSWPVPGRRPGRRRPATRARPRPGRVLAGVASRSGLGVWNCLMSGCAGVGVGLSGVRFAWLRRGPGSRGLLRAIPEPRRARPRGRSLGGPVNAAVGPLVPTGFK